MTDSWRDWGSERVVRCVPGGVPGVSGSEASDTGITGTWRCYTTYFCDICRLRWSVDSSD